MNILIVSHFFPPHKGGVETAAYNKAIQFKRMGHNVVIITSKVSEDTRNLIEIGNIIIYRFKSFYFPEFGSLPQSSHLGFMPKALFHIPKIIKKHKIDIIQVEGHVFPISLMVYLYNYFFFKLPIFIVIEGRLNEGIWRIIETIYDSTITKHLFKKVSRFICVSESLKKRLIQYKIQKKKLITITPGVDIFKFKKQMSSDYFDKYLPSKEYKKVLFVGRLDMQKGVSYLLKAIPLVIKEYEKVHFFILGNGKLESKLKKLADNLKILNYTTFLDSVPLDTLPIIYSSADIFCLPSIHEGFPLTIAEALSTGLIIVASATEGIPEAIVEGINGYLVQPKNILQLKNKLLKALNLNNFQRNQIERNNQISAKKNYSWEIISKKTITLYKEILAKNN